MLCGDLAGETMNSIFHYGGSKVRECILSNSASGRSTDQDVHNGIHETKYCILVDSCSKFKDKKMSLEQYAYAILSQVIEREIIYKIRVMITREKKK